MNMPTKRQVGWAIVVVVLVAVSLFFGVRYPLPAEPEDGYGESILPEIGMRSAGNVDIFSAVRVTNWFENLGTTIGNLVFEGATADEYETTLAITDATADRTITVPNSSGTIALAPAAGTWEFEGTTADEFETTLTVTDPTADRTVTIPNETGAVMMSSLATNATDAANSVTGASNGLLFEGATANEFETTVTVTDPTADRTFTLPNETAAVMVSSLTTNATDAANSVTGASNGLRFEGATANEYETTIAPTDPTADVTLTLPNETGTVALTSQAVDMTLEADTTGGNAGAKTEFIGLPRIKLIGLGAGTDPGSQSIVLADDNPEGEFAPVDASVTEAAEAAIYKFGAGSYKATWAADSAEDDGFVDAGLLGSASLEDQESVGLWLYTTVALASGDLQIVITDDAPAARKFNIPAVTANSWQWVEIDISSLAGGTGDVCTDFAITMTAQGAAAATLDAGFITYFDNGWVWDAPDEEALGVALQQDGVLGVINTESGAQLAEGTDWFVHYESGVDFIVWVTNQSAADVAVLAAY
jgi:hypothetical protein